MSKEKAITKTVKKNNPLLHLDEGITDTNWTIYRRLLIVLPEKVNGLGAESIKKILKHGSKHTLTLLALDYEQFNNINGIKKQQLRKLHNDMHHVFSSYKRSVLWLMRVGGFNQKTIEDEDQSHKEHDDYWLSILKNPYKLLIAYPTLATFKRCDIMANILGYKYDNPDRSEGLIFSQMIADLDEGNICSDSSQLYYNLVRNKKLAEQSAFDSYSGIITEAQYKNSIQKMQKKGVIFVEDHLAPTDHQYLYLPAQIGQETFIAANVANRLKHDLVQLDTYREWDERNEVWKWSSLPILMTEKALRLRLKQYQEERNVQLHEKQIDAIVMTFKHHFSILTGMPGTGKTTVLRALTEMIKFFLNRDIEGELISYNHLLKQVAPTGRAAQQMKLATGWKARTLHSLFQIFPGASNYKNVNSRWLIVDETSMLDQSITNIVLNHTNIDTHILFVGDYNQLPSIGPGKILNDMIQSQKVPVTKLTHIFRQAEGSEIVQNDLAILNGKEIDDPEGVKVNSVDADKLQKSSLDHTCVWINADDQQEINEAILKAVRIEKENGIKLEDLLVLSPEHRLESGVNYLNLSLQHILNPRPGDPDKIPYTNKPKKVDYDTFRTGDRVLQTKNDYNLHVINGDLGFISKKIPANDKSRDESEHYRRLAVTMDEYEDPIIYSEERKPKGDKETDNLQLGYSITVHKAQGSEASVIIVAVDPGHIFMLNRTLLYTAASRAKKKLIFVGDQYTFNRAIHKVKENKRRTLLKKRLQALIK